MRLPATRLSICEHRAIEPFHDAFDDWFHSLFVDEALWRVWVEYLIVVKFASTMTSSTVRAGNLNHIISFELYESAPLPNPLK